MIARLLAVVLACLVTACGRPNVVSGQTLPDTAVSSSNQVIDKPAAAGQDVIAPPTPAPVSNDDALEAPNIDSVEQSPVPVAAVSDVSAIEADWAAVPAGAEWTQFTAKAIDELGGGLTAKTPSDVAEFCPKYASLTVEYKRAFWVSLISAMARPESNFDPSVAFNEYDNCTYPGCEADFTTRDGRKVISRGLLQLSQESANGYQRFGCAIAIEDEETLHDPEVNLRCAVVILARWVSQDQVIASDVSPWRGGARYWSVLRRPNKKAVIQRFTAQTTYCKGV